MWCVPKLNEHYIERMEDILRLYSKHLDPTYPVLCMDEKSLQLFEDLRKPIPPKPGRIARKDYEYVRRGTANIFCAIQPLTGKQLLKVTQRRTRLDFAEFINDLSRAYPKARKIHLVMDNLNTHNVESLILRYGNRKGKKLARRFVLHYTPCHASWLNQAEIQIGCLSRAILVKRRYSCIDQLKINVTAYQKRVTRTPVPISWSFTVGKARKTFKYNEN